MRDFRDAKSMAQTLRDALSEKNISLGHSESLEIIAKAFGLKDWNTLAAKIQAGHAPPASSPAEPTAGHETIPKPLKRGTILPVALLRDVVVFPNMTLPITIGRERTIRALEQAVNTDRRILLVAQKVPTEEIPNAAGIYQMGVVGSVLQYQNADGWLMSFVRGHLRAAILQVTEDGAFYQGTVAPVKEDSGDKEKARTLARETYRQFQSYAKAADMVQLLQSFAKGLGWGPLPPPLTADAGSDPGRLADAIASRLRVSVGERQELLETTNITSRLEKILTLMKQSQEAA